MLNWQPIATAPKDGSWIMLGYYPDYMEGKCQGGKPRIGYWGGSTWVDECGTKLRKEGAFSPTHWTMLTPPKSVTTMSEN